MSSLTFLPFLPICCLDRQIQRVSSTFIFSTINLLTAANQIWDSGEMCNLTKATRTWGRVGVQRLQKGITPFHKMTFYTFKLITNESASYTHACSHARPCGFTSDCPSSSLHPDGRQSVPNLPVSRWLCQPENQGEEPPTTCMRNLETTACK